MGNYIANCLWEARLQPGLKKPGPDTPREEKERFIKAKYERKEWLATLPAPHSSALALAHSSLEEVNSCVSPRDARTPLHLAAALGNLPITQLLIWANANLGATDHDGRTC